MAKELSSSRGPLMSPGLMSTIFQWSMSSLSHAVRVGVWRREKRHGWREVYFFSPAGYVQQLTFFLSVLLVRWNCGCAQRTYLFESTQPLTTLPSPAAVSSVCCLAFLFAVEDMLYDTTTFPTGAHFVLAPPSEGALVSDVKNRILAMGVFEGINFYIAEKLVKDAPQVHSR